MDRNILIVWMLSLGIWNIGVGVWVIGSNYGRSDKMAWDGAWDIFCQ
jgi:hypothetical protein